MADNVAHRIVYYKDGQVEVSRQDGSERCGERYDNMADARVNYARSTPIGHSLRLMSRPGFRLYKAANGYPFEMERMTK